MSETEIADVAREAIRAHGIWKLKLSTAANSGNLPQPPSEIRRDDCCAFGKWLLQEATHPRSRNSANFHKVRDLHARFHKIAGDIAHQIETGNREAAKAAIEGPVYKKATSDLTSAVLTWRMQG